MTKKPQKTKKPAMAFLGKDKNGASIVGIGNIRVVIVQDENSWFAQGLEIDYAAQGTTIEDVKTQFEDGLIETVNEHLKVFGTIKKLLKVAPPEVWDEMLKKVTNKRYRYSQVSIHLQKTLKKSLPYEGIQFLTPEKQALTV
jgi:hypothetical protein